MTDGGGIALARRSPLTWEVPVGARPGMRTPGLVFADEALVESIRTDGTLAQVANAACLPGAVASIAMPDAHVGYGLPIGGVVATRVEDGVVSPGGVGFDINCGVRLARTRLHRDELGGAGTMRELTAALLARVPVGLGAGGGIRLSGPDQQRVLLQGARWAVSRGFGTAADLERTESGGCLAGADPDAVGAKALERGRDQLGTLGSGNHFLELQYVDEIYDERAASAFGLERGLVTLMIHSGSRGLGHQVCTDHIALMRPAMARHRIVVPDPQLACAPVRSAEGAHYLAAMRAAANYAWANRQCLMALAAEVLGERLHLSPSALGLALVYDVAHNVVKIERHRVDGRELELAVHRKGATRAFPAGHPEIPAAYRDVGQPVVVPGDMGRCSYLLAGQPGSLEQSFGSSAHGAGRRLSRAAAARAARGRSIARELEDRDGVIVRSGGRDTLAEELPEAYKDVAAVVAVLEGAGLARRVARLRPLGVVKG
jgi:tRNA-splicing ligase RtcB